MTTENQANLERMDMHTPDLSQSNLEKFKALFPNCVTEVEKDGKITLAIDADKLKQELSAEVIDGPKERYELTWPGKRKAMLMANAPITKTLRPARDESVNFDTTENLFIEGDNLEALKLLQESYQGKVKMIYIDPPYNTGNDFIYKDDFKQTTSEHLVASGQVNEEGNRLVANLESNGRFHTDWLNMMYSRISLAKNILGDGGTLLISIDEHEISNITLLCKEIFGDDNVSSLIWNKEAEGASGTLRAVSSFRRIHEYVVVCYKNYSQTQWNKVNEALVGRENEFQTANLAVNEENEDPSHRNYFTITNPENGISYTRQWKWGAEEIQRLLDNSLIHWGADGTNQPRRILPLDDRREVFLTSILNYGGTTVGREDFESLFSGTVAFSYPKPIILLKKLIQAVTNDSDIIVDFFAGSSSTTHALFLQNSLDGGNRKFIMVQWPEEIPEDHAAREFGAKNIADISKERIRRAGKQVLAGECHENWNKDIGFRVLKIDSSNMKPVYYTPSKLTQEQLAGMVDNFVEGRTAEDKLFQLMVDWGLELTLPISTSQIEGKTLYQVASNSLVACFDTGLSENFVREVAKLQPMRAVFLDNGFGDAFNRDCARENAIKVLKTSVSEDEEKRECQVKFI